MAEKKKKIFEDGQLKDVMYAGTLEDPDMGFFTFDDLLKAIGLKPHVPGEHVPYHPVQPGETPPAAPVTAPVRPTTPSVVDQIIQENAVAANPNPPVTAPVTPPKDMRQEIMDQYGVAKPVAPLPEGADPLTPMTDEEIQNFQSPATGIVPVSQMSDADLGTLLGAPLPPMSPYQNLDTQVVDEATMRVNTDKRNFIENISDPATAAWTIDRLSKQMGAGALNTFDVPAQLAGVYGLVSMPAEYVADLIDPAPKSTLITDKDPNTKRHDFGSSAALDYANERYVAAIKSMGIGEPRTMGESLANIAGSMIPIPGGKVEGAANLLEFATPFVVGDRMIPRLTVNFATGAVLDQGFREMFDGPDADYKTGFDLAGLPETTEAAGIGMAAVAATAPMWAPYVVHAMHTKKARVPTITRMTDIDRLYPPDLWSQTVASDELKSYIIDDKQVLMDAADRAGVPDPDMLRTRMDSDTQMGAFTKVTEGINTGNMRSPHGDFVSPVAPRHLFDTYNHLPAPLQADFDRYLKLGDYADTIQRRIAGGKPKPTDLAELSNIQLMRAQLRQAFPSVVNLSKDTQQYTESVRKYLATGPYSLMDIKTKQNLDKTQPHFIPLTIDPVDPSKSLAMRIIQGSKGGQYSDELSWLNPRNIDEIDMNTQNMRKGAMPELMAYGHSALLAQLQNNARGAWVDQMLKSTANRNGKPLIRKATDIEVGKYPDNVVKLWRNGKEEYYLTDSLYAHTLKMDPYVINNVFLQGLYLSRRAFEATTTGVKAITFAPTTGIRDTIAGWTNTAKGDLGPSITGTIKAPAMILGAKATNAFYRDIMARLDAGGEAWYLPGMDKTAQRQLAARLGATYQNSLYHIAKGAGGTDASLMKERIKLKKGMLAEVAKSMPSAVSKTYGVSLGPLFAGLGAVYDSMQEAPRYSAFERNLKAGKSADDAAKIARNITGDTMRSGRAYDNKGRLIRGNIQNPVVGGLNPALAWATEGIRVAVPYFNPSIQGMRRVAIAAGSDPTEFVLRNWMAVGLPSVAAYAWNQMLSQDSEDGHDYIKYQYEHRSGRDQVMEMYFGLPGLPPEQGISIPLAHESIPFMAPFQTYLYHLGDGDEEQMHAMTQTGITMLQNAAGIGVPPPLNAFLNLTGNTASQALFNPSEGVYPVREDNVGIFPQNIEEALRSQFGTTAAIGLDVAAAFAQDGDAMAAIDELAAEVASRTPIVKGVGGWKTNTGYFSPVGSDQRETLNAYNEFEKYWKEYYGNYGLTGDPDNSANLDFEDADTGDVYGVPYAKAGAEPLARPTNPIYEAVGQKIIDAIHKKDPYMFSESKVQMNALSDNIRLLKGFNAGRKDDFEAWQKELKTADTRLAEMTAAQEQTQATWDDHKGGPPSPEKAQYKNANDKAKSEVKRWQYISEMNTFINDHKIDLGNRFEVIRLTNLLENRRVDLMKHQLAVIHSIEDDMTDQLHAQGILNLDDKFTFKKHLAPMAGAGQGLTPPSPAPQ